MELWQRCKTLEEGFYNSLQVKKYKIKFSGKGLCILHGYQFLFFNLRTPRVLEILCIHNVTQKTKKGWCNITQLDVFSFFHVRNEIASTLQF